MLYTVIYDIKNSEREEIFLEELQKIGDNVLFMQHCYFLSSEENRNPIFNKLRRVMLESDLLFIGETPYHTLSGWLPTSAVEWINFNK